MYFRTRLRLPPPSHPIYVRVGLGIGAAGAQAHTTRIVDELRPRNLPPSAPPRGEERGTTPPRRPNKKEEHRESREDSGGPIGVNTSSRAQTLVAANARALGQFKGHVQDPRCDGRSGRINPSTQHTPNPQPQFTGRELIPLFIMVPALQSPTKRRKIAPPKHAKHQRTLPRRAVRANSGSKAARGSLAQP